ncbi:Hypothetical protein I596_2818 [Dokdonella koreensis DS-123]|uniref:Uncharacterized protein n=1 Tax=Dokdonella koreensis DS-123 TaxID=1300342 RepID=A0A167H434_9GAMM|nr:Hypothetical protein I596_2818 [Dokdonella koreensis DS-123]
MQCLRRTIAAAARADAAPCPARCTRPALRPGPAAADRRPSDGAVAAVPLRRWCHSPPPGRPGFARWPGCLFRAAPQGRPSSSSCRRSDTLGASRVDTLESGSAGVRLVRTHRRSAAFARPAAGGPVSVPAGA